MSSYMELIKFEYKKIFKKRSTVIILIIGIILTVISSVGTLLGNYYIEGEVFEGNYEGMKKDRAYKRRLSGREINADLLSEAIEAYSRIPFTEGIYHNTEEYQKYARPYNEIYGIIRKVYDIDNIRQLGSIPREKLYDFYAVRQRVVEKIIENTAMNDREKENSIILSRKVKTPFIYSYIDGYQRFITQMNTTAIIICFICIICISPLFAGEYAEGMDGLVFSAKYGKSKMIYAKIITGITFTILISLLFTFVTYLTVMPIFGWDGSGTPIQQYLPFTIDPFTFGQVAILYSIMILGGNILSSAITMALSAKLKSPFLVLVIMTAITIVPGFINVSENVLWLYHLIKLIPVKMFNLGNIIDVYSIDIFGLILRPYELIIIFAFIAGIALLPLAYRCFKNHK